MSLVGEECERSVGSLTGNIQRWVAEQGSDDRRSHVPARGVLSAHWGVERRPARHAWKTSPCSAKRHVGT